MDVMATEDEASGEVTTTEFRDRAAEVINQAAYGKRRTLITRHGKALAAVVPVEDLERLEALEEAADARTAAAVLARMERTGDRGIAWIEARRGLTRKKTRR